MGKIEYTLSIEANEALRTGNKELRKVCQNILCAIKNKAIDSRKSELTEEEEQQVIIKLYKQNKESIDTCPADRTDILSELEYERNKLEEFMPQQMSEVEIRQTIDEVLSSLGISTPTTKDKGRIMKELMPKVKGKADGKLVNQLLSTYFA